MVTDLRAPSDPSSASPLPAEATAELLQEAQRGDEAALTRLLERCLPPLRRWAHGRVPRAVRDMLETADVVQDVAIAAMRRPEGFEPRHQGALQAYLRQAVLNRLHDLADGHRRTPPPGPASQPGEGGRSSPLDQAVGADNTARYEAALQRLRPADREAIVGRLELQQSYEDLAVALDKPDAAAARLAVTRAMKRLADEMSHDR